MLADFDRRLAEIRVQLATVEAEEAAFDHEVEDYKTKFTMARDREQAVAKATERVQFHEGRIRESEKALAASRLALPQARIDLDLAEAIPKVSVSSWDAPRQSYDRCTSENIRCTLKDMEKAQAIAAQFAVSNRTVAFAEGLALHGKIAKRSNFAMSPFSLLANEEAAISEAAEWKRLTVIELAAPAPTEAIQSYLKYETQLSNTDSARQSALTLLKAAKGTGNPDWIAEAETKLAVAEAGYQTVSINRPIIDLTSDTHAHGQARLAIVKLLTQHVNRRNHTRAQEYQGGSEHDISYSEDPHGWESQAPYDITVTLPQTMVLPRPPAGTINSKRSYEKDHYTYLMAMPNSIIIRSVKPFVLTDLERAYLTLTGISGDNSTAVELIDIVPKYTDISIYRIVPHLDCWGRYVERLQNK